MKSCTKSTGTKPEDLAGRRHKIISGVLIIRILTVGGGCCEGDIVTGGFLKTKNQQIGNLKKCPYNLNVYTASK
jgi:hypothetical protein